MIAKAYPDEEEEALTAKRQREEEFAKGMEEHQQRFFRAVSDAKPYLDYAALLAGGAVVSVVLFTALHAFFSGAWSTERSLLVAAVAGYYVVQVHSTHDEGKRISGRHEPHPFGEAAALALPVLATSFSHAPLALRLLQRDRRRRGDPGVCLVGLRNR